MRTFELTKKVSIGDIKEIGVDSDGKLVFYLNTGVAMISHITSGSLSDLADELYELSEEMLTEEEISNPSVPEGYEEARDLERAQA